MAILAPDLRPGASTRDRHRPARVGTDRVTRTWNAVGLVVTALVALLWAMPLLWALDTAVKPEGETTAVPVSWLPSHFTLEAFRRVLHQGDLLRWFVNSTLVTVAVTALVVATASMAGFGFSRTRFRGRRVLFAAVLAGIMVPPQVLMVPLFHEMQSLGLVDTYAGVILPQVVAPAMVFILKKFFDGFPHELEEAARIDGASQWRIYLRIVLPLSRPVLAAVAIFTFITTWNNFLWPFIVTSDPHLMTLPVGLGSIQGSYGLRYAQIMAASILGGLPLLVAYVFFQRHVVRSIAHTGLGGR